MPLSPGQTINRYRIVKLLGQGGFGAVYRAFDLNLKVACALKENLETSGASQSQFEHEATILANLHHPSLPRVTDHFIIPGQGQYLVMDYIEGQDLETMQVNAGGSLPPDQVLNWMTQICDALAYMHGQPNPIIHRDIKPSNIIVRPDGRAMLVDFGIAKVFQAGGRTTIGARGVTPGFSPPEQYGQGHTDQQTDVYALGATMYAMLTGVTPPESVEMLRNVSRIAPIRTLNPKVPAHIAAAVECAMQLDPKRRFQRAADFKLALTTPGKITKIPTQPPTGGRGFPWAWAALGGGLTLVVLIVLGVGGYLIYNALNDGNPPGSSAAEHATATLRSEAAAPTRTSPAEPPATLPPAPTTDSSGQVIASPVSLPTYTPFPTAVSSPTSLPPSPTTVASSGPILLAYVRGPVGDSDIFISDDSGGSTVCIACTSCDESDPSFGPDGEHLLYQSGCAGGYEIVRVSVSEGYPTPLTSTSTYDEREPHYSPDGRNIVYQRLPSGESRNSAGDIRIMNGDGSNDHSLGITGRHPVFSPDGNSIAYMSDVSGRWQIYVYNLVTFTNQQLTSCATNCRWPAWSPDGRFIVYNLTVSASSMDPDGIEYIPVGGGSATTLIRDEACGRPDWSESGWISFNSSRGIEVIQSNGSDRTLLVNFTDAWSPVWSR